MGDFHLGDKIEWTTQKALNISGTKQFKTGIIIDLLDYEGENCGVVGVILDDTNEIKSIPALECRLYRGTTWEDEYDWHDRMGFPPSDVY